MNRQKPLLLGFITLFSFACNARADDSNHPLNMPPPSVGNYQSNTQGLNKSEEALIKQLNLLGIDNKDALDFVTEVKGHKSNGSFNLMKEDVPTGQLTLRLHLSSADTNYGTMTSPIHQDRKQLVYTPDFDHNVSITAARGSVIAGWHFKFD